MQSSPLITLQWEASTWVMRPSTASLPPASRPNSAPVHWCGPTVSFARRLARGAPTDSDAVDSGVLCHPALMFSDAGDELGGSCLRFDHELDGAEIGPALEHLRIADVAENDDGQLARVRVAAQT